MNQTSPTVRVMALQWMDGDALIVQAHELDVAFEELRTAFGAGEEGPYTIRIYEMPLTDFEALPEWDGF